MKNIGFVMFSALVSMLGCTYDADEGQFSMDLTPSQAAAHRLPIEGIYRGNHLSNDSRYEEMRIEALGGQRYRIWIETQGSVEGCQFDAEATLVDNQFRIPLSMPNLSSSAQMVILFKGRDVMIDTLSPENFGALKAFCRSGSLIGGYHKIK